MKEVYRVIFTPDAENDLAVISDHLFESYVHFDEDIDMADIRAGERVKTIRDAAMDFGRFPKRGTLGTGPLDGLRYIRIKKAVYWFKVVDSLKTVYVLAIFFGGQDHVRHMLKRLL